LFAHRLHEGGGERTLSRASVKQANFQRMSLEQRCHERPDAFWREELPQLLFPLGVNIGKHLGTSKLKDSGSS